MMRTTSGHFFKEMIMDSKKMLKEQQLSLTIDEQIENLKSLKMDIPDEKFAREFLNDVSYFRLVKAYSLGMKSKNGNYYPGVTFEQLTELYRFNSNFRALLFPLIERIEINFRCRISNYFCEKYGVLGYKNKDNFSVYSERFEQDVEREIKRNSRTPFIRNFKENYIDGEIPMYALIEILSFGMISKLYKNMHNFDKKEIALIYGISYPYLESWIESISYVRNICAHYGRLYNITLIKKPKLYKDDIEYGLSNDRMMGILICFKRLLPDDRHWYTFLENLDYLLKKYPHVKKEKMGLHDDWKEILKMNI